MVQVTLSRKSNGNCVNLACPSRHIVKVVSITSNGEDLANPSCLLAYSVPSICAITVRTRSLFSRHNGPVDLFLPAALSAAGQWAFGMVAAKMSYLLTFGTGCPMVIVPSLVPSAGLMRRSHIGGFIGTTKFECPYMLRDPTFTGTIDLLVAYHTPASCCLPHFQPPVWGKSAAARRPDILNLNKRHRRLHPRLAKSVGEVGPSFRDYLPLERQ
jgi:hypothetical protein